jgi:hypothetical protein
VETINAYRLLVRKPTGKDATRKTKKICDWIILRWILTEMILDDLDWIDLIRNKDRRRAFVIAAMNLRVP